MQRDDSPIVMSYLVSQIHTLPGQETLHRGSCNSHALQMLAMALKIRARASKRRQEAHSGRLLWVQQLLLLGSTRPTVTPTRQASIGSETHGVQTICSPSLLQNCLRE